jgi:hypothetical protein
MLMKEQRLFWNVRERECWREMGRSGAVLLGQGDATAAATVGPFGGACRSQSCSVTHKCGHQPVAYSRAARSAIQAAAGQKAGARRLWDFKSVRKPAPWGKLPQNQRRRLTLLNSQQRQFSRNRCEEAKSSGCGGFGRWPQRLGMAIIHCMRTCNDAHL